MQAMGADRPDSSDRVVVQFVGAGDAFGSGGRGQACLSVRWSHSHVLIDCGATAMVGLKRLGLDPGTVDAVLISHLHGDHFGGLPFLVLDQQFARRARDLTVAGPPGLADRLRVAMETFFPGSSTVERRFRLNVVELAPRLERHIGAARVTAREVDHASAAPALALRVQCGQKTIAYSGDTAWTPALVDVAANADLFVCEAYSFDRPIRYHLDYVTLDQHLTELGCERLVLTHLGPDALAHRAELGADVADDGATIVL